MSWACSSDDKEYIERPVEELYNDAMDALLDGEYDNAAELFDEVERQHPYSVWASKAQLMSAFASMQGPFVVAVWDTGEVGCWDVARDHFGTETTMTRHRSAGAVLHAISEGSATIGVLPLPQDGEADPWWPGLAVGQDDRLQICARVPFASRGNSRASR